MDEFLAQLGSETGERPVPTLKGAVVAAAAVLAVLGLVAIALDGYDGDTNVLGIVFGLVAIAAGYTIELKLDLAVRPAGRALIALGTLVTLGFVFDDIDTPTLLLALLAAAYIGQWAWSPARGSMILLTLGLLSIWGFVLDIAADDSTSRATNFDTFEPIPNTSFTSGDETVAYLSLALGALLLFGARTLDKRGWLGVSTSAIVVGDIAFVVGVFGVVGAFDSDTVGSILIIGAGLILTLVGATAGRRFTTWLGGIGVLIGLVALILTVFDSADAVQFGITATVVGVAVIAAVAFIDTDGLRSTPTTTPEVPASVPGWHPDPGGRHELRWHDGTDWTANVSDRGETSTDDGV
jgi:uncharacterized protein DUF2510